MTMVEVVTNEVVTNEADLKANLLDDATISIGADIYLTSAVTINGVTGLYIEGNNFRIDGQQKDGCFYITSGSELIFTNMTITNGHTVMNIDVKLRTYNFMLKLMSFPYYLIDISIGWPLLLHGRISSAPPRH